MIGQVSDTTGLSAGLNFTRLKGQQFCQHQHTCKPPQS